MEAMEGGRPLLAIAMGPKGIAPLRAALEWAPVQVAPSNIFSKDC
jgi:hypothetical protein